MYLKLANFVHSFFLIFEILYNSNTACLKQYDRVPRYTFIEEENVESITETSHMFSPFTPTVQKESYILNVDKQNAIIFEQNWILYL